MHLHRITVRPDRYPTRDRYPFNLEIFHSGISLGFSSPVVFFAGENGTGKSTLLRAICRACGIYIWQVKERPRLRPNPLEDLLYRAVDVGWSNGSVPGSFFGSEIFRHFAELLDEWAAADPGQLKYFGGESLITQSHGQSLMSYFRSRYRIRGVYFADEPETALSPKSQLELLRLLTELARAGHAQFIMATHSPILLACPGAEIYSFDSVPIRRIAYEETSHYRVYRDFLAGMTLSAAGERDARSG